MYAFFESILRFFNDIVNNYGVAIILFTILVRLVLMPFDYKSRKSMRRMEKVNPQLQVLQKKYANDKEKLQRKQAELYKKEGINPLGSCLPMLLTFPILIVMFGAMRNVANLELVKTLQVLHEKVGSLTEAEQIIAALPSYEAFLADYAEPFLWIKNLWVADSPFTSILPDASTALATLNQMNPVEGVLTAEQLTALKDFVGNAEIYSGIILPHYGAVAAPGWTINLILFQLTFYKVPNGFFILPILSFVTQFFTNSLNPQQQQAGSQQGGTGKFMKWFFPIFSLYICATSNAAFSLYWVVTNIVSMVQQIGFRMYFEAQDAKAAAKTEEVSL